MLVRCLCSCDVYAQKAGCSWREYQVKLAEHLLVREYVYWNQVHDFKIWRSVSQLGHDVESLVLKIDINQAEWLKWQTRWRPLHMVLERVAILTA